MLQNGAGGTMTGYWFCEGCNCEIDARAVTYLERHALCGARVY